jgi:hypothetical protein
MENYEIKSPTFKAEPGWGGMLAIAFKHNFYTFVLPILVIVTVLFSIHTLSDRYTEYANTQMGITIGAISKPTITIVAEAGQGISHLARRALDDYLVSNPSTDMNPGRKAYVVNYVSNLYKNVPVISGKIVEFQKNDMILAIQKSKELKDYQLEEWAKYYSN